MTQIDYFFATLSPYSYLAGTRLEEVAAKHGATINYKPLDIIAVRRQPFCPVATTKLAGFCRCL